MAKEKENKVAEEEAPAVAEKQRELVLNPATAEQGTVQITSNVVAQIIKKNVLSVEGVARFAPKGVADIVNVFSSRSYDSSIGIEFVDGAISVTVSVLAYLGTALPKMAQEIQDRICSQIAEATGAEVRTVNVLVKDLVSPEDEAPAEGADGEAETAPAEAE